MQSPCSGRLIDAGQIPARTAPRRQARPTGFRGAPYRARYLPPFRRTWFFSIKVVSAFETDISPDLSPFIPIRSRSSPRERLYRLRFLGHRIEPYAAMAAF